MAALEYHMVKNFGGKSVWLIRIARSLAKNCGKLKPILQFKLMSDTLKHNQKSNDIHAWSLSMVE